MISVKTKLCHLQIADAVVKVRNKAIKRGKKTVITRKEREILLRNLKI